MEPVIDTLFCLHPALMFSLYSPYKPNPLFKGKWYAPMIDNPDYKGEWAPRKIANPNYFEDLTPAKSLSKIVRFALPSSPCSLVLTRDE